MTPPGRVWPRSGAPPVGPHPPFAASPFGARLYVRPPPIDTFVTNSPASSNSLNSIAEESPEKENKFEVEIEKPDPPADSSWWKKLGFFSFSKSPEKAEEKGLKRQIPPGHGFRSIGETPAQGVQGGELSPPPPRVRRTRGERLRRPNEFYDPMPRRNFRRISCWVGNQGKVFWKAPRPGGPS